jgi:[acyl-carrier-protein] S-malonyltransferase
MSGAALPSPSRPGGRLRALVLCPGRGSYGRDSLGQLQALPRGPAQAVVDAFDAARSAQGLPTTRSLDAEPALRPALHAAGEHASALTAACSLADVAQIDPERFEIVGVCGNSMGWYTALTAGGALPLADGVQLIETFGGWQRDNIIGGQVLLPLTDEEWRPEPWRLDRVNDLVQQIPDLHWSIRLGGQAVLGGTEAALAALSAAVPPEERAGVRFPAAPAPALGLPHAADVGHRGKGPSPALARLACASGHLDRRPGQLVEPAQRRPGRARRLDAGPAGRPGL